MKSYDEIKEGQTLFTSKDGEEVWEVDNYDAHLPLGTLPQYTRLKVNYIDGSEVCFKILEGEHKGKTIMWAWWGDGEAKPGDLLTKKEYEMISGNFEVNDISLKENIKDIEKALAGVNLEKFKALVQYYENKNK
ncbi:hypothetical protein F4V43_01945 [Paenibacillus spiritus]|uniref:Uncharacterized protein n=1 Tax=Paenibacillus spiritus TaxID=2496557 RepID=A0A5J5GGJ2_9BACL|nr:hypothetical protein [Paenibacillus spiritus]KAA9007271.1 hypothetical protein F4V43_01945 [Paenibacillus spiritus]